MSGTLSITNRALHGAAINCMAVFGDGAWTFVQFMSNEAMIEFALQNDLDIVDNTKQPEGENDGKDY